MNITVTYKMYGFQFAIFTILTYDCLTEQISSGNIHHLQSRIMASRLVIQFVINAH